MASHSVYNILKGILHEYFDSDGNFKQIEKESPTPKLPREHPIKVEYLKVDYTKKTAQADAIKRLKTAKSIEYKYDKKKWIFAEPSDRQDLYSQYGEEKTRMVGDVRLFYLSRTT